MKPSPPPAVVLIRLSDCVYTVDFVRKRKELVRQDLLDFQDSFFISFFKKLMKTKNNYPLNPVYPVKFTIRFILDG